MFNSSDMFRLIIFGVVWYCAMQFIHQNPGMGWLIILCGAAYFVYGFFRKDSKKNKEKQHDQTEMDRNVAAGESKMVQDPGCGACIDADSAEKNKEKQHDQTEMDRNVAAGKRKMVRDPECGAYIDADSATITMRDGDTVQYFCSDACFNAFMKRRQGDSGRLSVQDRHNAE